LVAPFGDARVGATSGAKVIMHGDGALGDTEGLYWRYEDFVKRQETRLGSTTGVCGEILAIRRELFTPAPASTINDDFYLALDVIRRGYDVVYIRDARSYERVSLSAEDERGRRARIVAGRYQAMFTYRLLPRRPLVAWQVLSHKYLRPLIPLAMAGAFLSNLLVLRQRRRFLSGPFGAILFIAQLIFYAASLVGMRLEQTKGVARFLFLPAYLVSSNAAVLAGLFRYLRGTQPVAWQRAPRRRSDSPHHAKS
jgi:cellulose synthase/poly-beta-1,6-N-acetylglucosamine synthase-like glycosyltransferase